MIYLNIKNKTEREKIEKILDEFSLIHTNRNDEDCEICIIDLSTNNIQSFKNNRRIVIALKHEDEKGIKRIVKKSKLYYFETEEQLRIILRKLTRKKTRKFPVHKLAIVTVGMLFVLSALFFTRENGTINAKVEKIDYKKENFVFLGDSITDFYNLETFYGNLPTVNSGTSGFQTPDIIKHLKDYVYIYNPTKIFLLVGTNDIAFTDITNQELINNFEKIIDEIKKNRPNSKLYIESIYPVNRNTDNDVVLDWMVGKRENSRIVKINTMLKKLCEEKEVTYINMYDKLTDENGNLKLEYTIDGLHISPEGYKVITNTIMKYIDPTNGNAKKSK